MRCLPPDETLACHCPVRHHDFADYRLRHMVLADLFDWSRAFEYLQQPYDVRFSFGFIEIDDFYLEIVRHGCKSLVFTKNSSGFYEPNGK